MGLGTLISTGSFFNVGSIAIGVGICVVEIVSGVASLVGTEFFWMGLGGLVGAGVIFTIGR